MIVLLFFSCYSYKGGYAKTKSIDMDIEEFLNAYAKKYKIKKLRDCLLGKAPNFDGKNSMSLIHIT